MGIISITSCQGLPMRDLIPLSTDKWLTNNWPMTDRYCAISYQFFWLESLFLVILDCKSILVLLIYWFYEIFPSISIFNNVFILFFRCCCNKYVTGVISGYLLTTSYMGLSVGRFVGRSVMLSWKSMKIDLFQRIKAWGSQSEQASTAKYIFL